MHGHALELLACVPCCGACTWGSDTCHPVRMPLRKSAAPGLHSTGTKGACACHLVPLPAPSAQQVGALLQGLASPVPVRVRVEAANALSNRFRADARISTQGVLSLDDDIFMSCADVERGWAAWRAAPAGTLVGYHSRLVQGAPPIYRCSTSQAGQPARRHLPQAVCKSTSLHTAVHLLHCHRRLL